MATAIDDDLIIEYIDQEYKFIINLKNRLRIAYPLLLAIILNIFVLLLTKTDTIVLFVFNVITDFQNILLLIFTIVLIIPVVMFIFRSIKYFVSDEQFYIYYPNSKYEKLKEKYKALAKDKKP